MFALDLDVKMQIVIPDDLNARLEQGEDRAFLELEKHLIDLISYSHGGFEVKKLQIEDAGPHNDAGQWGPSKFHS